MATIKQFEIEAEKLSFQEAMALKKALTTLLNWEFFKQEYRKTGLEIIKSILSETVIKKA